MPPAHEEGTTAPDGPADDEGSLWSRWRGSADAAAKLLLVERYKPLAKMIAAAAYGRRVHNQVEFDDYLQFALVGLLEAVERYDPSRGAMFKTYAVARIRGTVLSGLDRMTERHDQAAMRRRLERERIASLLPELGGGQDGDPLLRQLGEIGVSVALAIILDGLGLGADARSSGQVDPYAQVELQQARSQVRAMVTRLPERERAVVDLLYGQECTLDEIGQVLDVSRSRACQLHRKALERLRELVSKAAGCDASF